MAATDLASKLKSNVRNLEEAFRKAREEYQKALFIAGYVDGIEKVDEARKKLVTLAQHEFGFEKSFEFEEELYAAAYKLLMSGRTFEDCFNLAAALSDWFKKLTLRSKQPCVQTVQNDDESQDLPTSLNESPTSSQLGFSPKMTSTVKAEKLALRMTQILEDEVGMKTGGSQRGLNEDLSALTSSMFDEPFDSVNDTKDECSKSKRMTDPGISDSCCLDSELEIEQKMLLINTDVEMTSLAPKGAGVVSTAASVTAMASSNDSMIIPSDVKSPSKSPLAKSNLLTEDNNLDFDDEGYIKWKEERKRRKHEKKAKKQLKFGERNQAETFMMDVKRKQKHMETEIEQDIENKRKKKKMDSSNLL